jgi:hypothetical protein
MGIFGNTAPILVDINLILQYVVLILLIVGYVKRKPYKIHGRIMSIVTLLTFATILLIMSPSLVLNFGEYELTIFIHVGVGILATLLGFIFSLRFNKALRSGQPFTCGTRYQMWLTFILWLIPLLGGTFLYLTRYVFL